MMSIAGKLTIVLALSCCLLLQLVQSHPANERNLAPATKRGAAPTNQRNSAIVIERSGAPTDQRNPATTSERGVAPTNKRGPASPKEGDPNDTKKRGLEDNDVFGYPYPGYGVVDPYGAYGYAPQPQPQVLVQPAVAWDDDGDHNMFYLACNNCGHGRRRK
uniref:Uncharacterized protein n=1 Tax=Plectus sambesii TaxID=2011161 RepID=A0A914WZS9_9BILA